MDDAQRAPTPNTFQVISGRALRTILREQNVPPRLKKAMEYALFGGGKRLRPFLLVECSSLFHVLRRRAIFASAALECVHAYSLVHDDLPAMDNAATRRGKLSTHKKFDEATAILAGDALLTLAFEILSSPAVHPDPVVRLELIAELAKAAGASGMVGGQMLDLEVEDRYAKQKPSLKQIRTMQQLKTAALFSFAGKASAILGDASKKQREALENFGTLFGEAFQIADDLKDTKADMAADKVTFVTFVGEQKARAKLGRLIQRAKNELKPFGKSAGILKSTVSSLAI